MSWWNTSNFTDLASKALKNAQKKIDSALEISEGTAGQDTTGASVQKAESKSKGDFWGTWGIGSTSDDNTGAAGAWSLPWGASTGETVPGTTSDSLVKVKSAEEIKSEVLKAAKERTKAKAKLFPKKVKPVSGNEKLIESVTEVTEVKTSASVKLKPPDTGDTVASKGTKHESEIQTTETVQSFETLEDTKDSTLNVIDTIIEGSVTKDNPVSDMDLIDKTKTEDLTIHSETFFNKSGSIDSKNEGEKDHFHTENSAFKKVERKNVEMPEQEKPEIQAYMSEETTVVSTVDEETDERYNKQEKTCNTERGESQVTEPEVEADTDSLKHSDTSVLENVSEKIEKSLEENIGDTNIDASDINLMQDFSSGDISSSVEFVTDRDIPVDENIHTCDAEQSSSDLEIIDCDKTNFDEECDSVKKVCADTPSYEQIEEENLHTGDEFSKEEGKTSETLVTETSQGSGSLNELKTESELPEEGTINLNENLQTDKVERVETDSAQPEDSINISCDESLLMILPESVTPEAVKSLRSSDSESSVNKLDTSMETCTSEDTVIESGTSHDDSMNEKSGLASKIHEMNAEQNIDISECKDGENIAETSTEMLDIKSESEENDMDKCTISPAHSFVKCMLEDAIEEGKHGDDNSDSHSSIEKSEGSRSIYSNQESGDEIDTTTSSDIEIISMPTPNGENRQVSPLDPIPLRIALQKTSWRGSPTHRRTDSSDSSNASGANFELSPGRESSDYAEYHKAEHVEGHSHAPELPALSEEDDNPYHPQRLLKDETNTKESHDMRSEGQMSPDPPQKSCDLDQMSHDPQTLEQKMGDMAEILQAREEKLLTLSKENCDLMEANSILRSQLQQAEEAREAEMTDVNELTAEFTQRLTDAEMRVSSAIKEKEVIKKQLQDSQAELAKRAGDVSLKEILAEKEEQISELLQEGEKLSKSQLQSNTIIKKLRQKEKDNDSTITSQKKKIETQTTELEHLHKVLESKEDLEKKQSEAIAQLTSAVKKQEQEMVKLKSEHEDATEKARGLQVALDNSYKEMAELHRNSAAQDSKAHEAALSAEMQVREELKRELEKQQQQHKWSVESLNMQIDDHRLSMTRMEKEYNRREDLLKQEIADLQKQLQEDEARNQELTQGVSLATRPLLRQIENLQSTYNAQSSTWEKVERNISERLSETQNQLAVAMEKERTANEQVMELGSKVTSLETQNSRLKQERSQLTAQLEMLKAKVEMSEDAKQNEAAQIEVMKQQMGQEIQDLKKQKLLLETQLDVEKSKLEQERKKTVMFQDQIRDLERDIARSSSRSRGTPVRATPSPVSVSRQDSMVGSLHEHSFSAITQEELDRSFVLASPNGNKQSLYEALRQSGAANLLENLQSQLKLREGEISHLQNEIRTLERTRESMARELVDLSNKNDNLEEKVKDLPLLEEQYTDLDQRYNALLQMYGEKTEEAEELKLDLVDVKEMYKAQINHLLSQS